MLKSHLSLKIRVQYNQPVKVAKLDFHLEQGEVGQLLDLVYRHLVFIFKFFLLFLKICLNVSFGVCRWKSLDCICQHLRPFFYVSGEKKGFFCLFISLFQAGPGCFQFSAQTLEQKSFPDLPHSPSPLCVTLYLNRSVKPVCLDHIPMDSPLFFKYLHIKQNQEQKKDIFSLLLTTKKKGKMKFVCVEEQKLMGDVNSPPSWHRVETRYYNKMIYLTIWFL